MALVLLVGAGLLMRSFLVLLDVNPGFDANNVVTISTQMPAAARTPALRAALYRTIRDRLMAIPGVVNVGAVSRLPMTGKNLGSLVFIEGKSVPGQPWLRRGVSRGHAELLRHDGNSAARGAISGRSRRRQSGSGIADQRDDGPQVSGPEKMPWASG